MVQARILRRFAIRGSYRLLSAPCKPGRKLQEARRSTHLEVNAVEAPRDNMFGEHKSRSRRLSCRTTGKIVPFHDRDPLSRLVRDPNLQVQSLQILEVEGRGTSSMHVMLVVFLRCIHASSYVYSSKAILFGCTSTILEPEYSLCLLDTCCHAFTAVTLRLKLDTTHSSPYETRTASIAQHILLTCLCSCGNWCRRRRPRCRAPPRSAESG